MEQIYGCKNNPENSSRSKVSEHIPSVLTMSTISSFKSVKNKHDMYRGKSCIKNFLWFLKRARNENDKF